jgi:cytoskeletal protein CcmA (bactofilin family)
MFKKFAKSPVGKEYPANGNVNVSGNTATSTFPPDHHPYSSKVNNSTQYMSHQNSNDTGYQSTTHNNIGNLDQNNWNKEFSTFTEENSPINTDLVVEEPETIIGKDVSFKGELSFERFVRINGYFEGTLNAKGKLIVGTSGIVKSDVDLHEAIIEGQVEGNITADRVELRVDAQVKGNITAKSFSVDEGTSIIGQVKVIPADDK